MAAAPDLKPVYLLTGSDRPKIETALARLRRHFEPEAVELVTAQEVSGADAAALCNVGSLFGDARLVVIEGVDGRRNADGRLANGWKVADVKAVEEYLSSPAPGTVLALVAEELKKDAPLTKACAKAGDVLAFEVAKRNVANWVAERFKQAGARAEPDACAALVHLVGEDFHQLANEIDKLALWAGGEPIGQNEVELLVAAVAETPTFALTDAWAQRDGGMTLAASETIFEREGRPRRDTAPRMAGALTNHLAFMRRCQHLAAEGARPRDAASTLKRHPFYVEKVFAQAANFSEDELREAIVRLAELDHALKGGSKLAPDLELQLALIDLSAEG
jgi:DNA polymerase-3 subunit delta